jgi:hypothetical protein
MTQQINVLVWSATISGMAFEDGLTGKGGQSFRVNAGGTGFEYYTPAAGTIVGVNATSPLTASGTTTRTLALAGLTTVGTTGQVPMSDGTAWFYQGTTGTSTLVRSASPTFTGTITAAAANFSGQVLLNGVASLAAAPFGVRSGTNENLYVRPGSALGSAGIALDALNDDNSAVVPFTVRGDPFKIASDAEVTGTFTVSSLAGTGSRLLLGNGSGTLAPQAFGSAFQVLRMNSGATALEWYDPTVGDITSVTGTSPIVVTSGTGPVPNVTLAGLTTVGTTGQVPMSDGTAWFYQGTTGTSTLVRSASPTLSGTVGGSFVFSGELTFAGGSGASVSVAPITLANDRIIVWRDSASGLTNAGFMWYDSSDALNFGTSNSTKFSISSTGVLSSGSFAGTAFRPIFANSLGVLSALSIGAAGQSIRLTSDASGWEYYTPAGGDVTGVTGTSPIIVSSGTGPVPNVTLAGLTTVGTGGQVPMSDGTAWFYQGTTGTSTLVRSASPTFTGTVTAASVNLTGLLSFTADNGGPGQYGIGRTAADGFIFRAGVGTNGDLTFLSADGTPFARNLTNSTEFAFLGALYVTGAASAGSHLLTGDVDGKIGSLAIGTAGQSIRVNSGATGFEYYTPTSGDVTGVTGTSPIIVSSGTGPVPNVTLAGLTTVGTGGQVPMSDGTAWFYQGTTGTSTLVRSASPTFTGTIIASSLTATGNVLLGIGSGGGGSFAVAAGNNVLGFFDTTPVAPQDVAEYTQTAWPNPVTDTAAFNSAVSSFLDNYRTQQGALGQGTGYGLLNLT